MTEEEDEDFYVRYYVVRDFLFPFLPPESLSLSLSFFSSFFFFAFCALRDLHFSHRETVLCVRLSPSLSLSLCVSDVVVLFFTQGHKGKFGHEFLEFEFKPNGKLRYANNSNYKGDKCIRKEMCVSKAGECIFV